MGNLKQDTMPVIRHMRDFDRNSGNRLERCKIKDPSVNNWAAIVEAVQGNIIADFPVINKSFNLSYSGTDR